MSHRPAYMDDFERLEDDLKKLYDTYMVRFRNLAYLEHQLEEYHRVERDRLKVRLSNVWYVWYRTFGMRCLV